jgi:hypothetical protein
MRERGTEVENARQRAITGVLSGREKGVVVMIPGAVVLLAV